MQRKLNDFLNWLFNRQGTITIGSHFNELYHLAVISKISLSNFKLTLKLSPILSEPRSRWGLLIIVCKELRDKLLIFNSAFRILLEALLKLMPALTPALARLLLYLREVLLI